MEFPPSAGFPLFSQCDDVVSCAAADPAGASWLPSLRPMRWVVELRSLNAGHVMAKVTKYYLCVRDGNPVGPHNLDSLREWVDVGVISKDWQVCREDEQIWISIAQILGFDDFPPKLRERLDHSRNQPRPYWWSHPPTDKQLKKLRYFKIPFDSTGLTKGRASELIDAFAKIDPAREEQYQNRPATAAQAKEISSLGGDPSNLTYSDARELIEELRSEKGEQEWESAFTFSLLEDRFNDRDAREIGHYKKLTKAQLQQLLEYFSKHVPDWEERSRFDLCDLVPKLFPEQIKAQRTTSRASRRRTKSSGCLVLLLAAVILLIIMCVISTQSVS